MCFEDGFKKKLDRHKQCVHGCIYICVSVFTAYEVRFHLTGGRFSRWIVQILQHKEDFAGNISASHLITVSLSPVRRSFLRSEKSSFSSVLTPRAPSLHRGILEGFNQFSMQTSRPAVALLFFFFCFYLYVHLKQAADVGSSKSTSTSPLPCDRKIT